MKTSLRTIAFLPLAVLLAFGIQATSVPASAQTGSFTISQHGSAVGTASFTFKGTPQGYDSTSMVSVTMLGLTYRISKNEKLSSANQLEHVQLSATVNGSAVSVTAKPDAAQMLMNISANGRSSTTRLAAHPASVFLPDFDPGALETLLALAVSHNNSNLWAIIPKKSGSVEPVQLATYADQRGTLDGKPITVHHMVATIAGAKTDLFSGPESQLLQAEMPEGAFALVRKGFVLTPPAKPDAPPEPPPATPSQ